MSRNTLNPVEMIRSLMIQAERNNQDSFNYYIPENKCRECKQLISYHYIREDIMTSIETTSWIGQIMEIQGEPMNNHKLCSTLWHSIIIIYNRCFTANKAKITRLESKDVFKGSTELADVHEDLVNYRNGFVAHRGQTGMDSAVLLVKKSKYLDTELTAEVCIHKAAYIGQDLELYIKLFKHVLAYVDNKIEVLRKIVSKKYASANFNELDDLRLANIIKNNSFKEYVNGGLE